MEKNDRMFLEKAIEKSIKNIDEGGGPFGALIVKEDRVIASSGNHVTLSNDPTAHAEISAIREACKILGTFSLEGCTLYSSCEPCPMCLGAIYWARLDKLVFAASKEDAKDAGFDDSFIYEEIQTPMDKRKIRTIQELRNEALEAFDKWKKMEDKTEY
jgi:tRNA(Arg) A34 adenosine deaminase TadA